MVALKFSGLYWPYTNLFADTDRRKTKNKNIGYLVGAAFSLWRSGVSRGYVSG